MPDERRLGRAAGRGRAEEDEADNGLLVRFAVDRKGERFEAHEVRCHCSPPRFFCPKCDSPVHTKHPRTKRTHFAHCKGWEHECVWRTPGAFERTVATERSQAVDELTSSGYMRVVLRVDPHVEAVSLHGLVPAVTVDEESRLNSAGHGLDALDIRSQGVAGDPRGADFSRVLSDSKGNIVLKLDPNAPRFVAGIKGPDSLPTIDANWKSNALSHGTLFVGDEDSAEIRRKPRWLRSDDTLYLVYSASSRDPLPPEILSGYSLGKWCIYKLPATPVTVSYLSRYHPDLHLDSDPLRVDVVLPIDVDPRPERMLQAPQGTKALFAVRGPAARDPELELVPVPLRVEQVRQFPVRGPGLVRFLEAQIDAEAESAVIYWPLYPERSVLIGTSPAAERETKPLMSSHMGIDVGGAFVHAFEAKKIDLDPILEFDRQLEKYVLPQLKVSAPIEMRTSLRARYEKGWLPESPLESGDVTIRVEALFRAGARELIVGFDTLGRVTMKCDRFADDLIAAKKAEERRLDAQKEAQNKRDAEIRAKLAEREARREPGQGPTTEGSDSWIEKIRARAQRATPRDSTLLHTTPTDLSQARQPTAARPPPKPAWEKEKTELSKLLLKSHLPIPEPRDVNHSYVLRLKRLPPETPPAATQRARNLLRQIIRDLDPKIREARRRVEEEPPRQFEEDAVKELVQAKPPKGELTTGYLRSLFPGERLTHEEVRELKRIAEKYRPAQLPQEAASAEPPRSKTERADQGPAAPSTLARLARETQRRLSKLEEHPDEFDLEAVALLYPDLSPEDRSRLFERHGTAMRNAFEGYRRGPK